jgi:hypothetical protein
MFPLQALLTLNQSTFRAIQRIATGYVLPLVVRPLLIMGGIGLFLLIGWPHPRTAFLWLACVVGGPLLPWARTLSHKLRQLRSRYYTR